MVRDAALTSWDGCPQSRLLADVVATRNRPVLEYMTHVARDWDDILGRNPIQRWVHRQRQPRRASLQEYGQVLACVGDTALEATLAYIGELRQRERVRRNLRAVAFLERYEAVIAHEHERRLSAGKRPVSRGTVPARTPAAAPAETVAVTV